MAKQPERAYVLTAKIEADTAEDMSQALNQMARDINGGMLTTGVWGSPRHGGVYEFRRNEDITHDSYFESLDAHLAQLHAEEHR